MSTFLNDEQGATALEYAMIASLISIVLVISGALIGESVENMFLLVLSKM